MNSVGIRKILTFVFLVVLGLMASKYSFVTSDVPLETSPFKPVFFSISERFGGRVAATLWFYWMNICDGVLLGIMFRSIARIVRSERVFKRRQQMAIMVVTSLVNVYLITNVIECWKSHGRICFLLDLRDPTWWYCMAIVAVVATVFFFLVDFAIDGVKKILQISKSHKDDAKSA